jgi:hypothetical protein
LRDILITGNSTRSSLPSREAVIQEEKIGDDARYRPRNVFELRQAWDL